MIPKGDGNEGIYRYPTQTWSYGTRFDIMFGVNFQAGEGKKTFEISGV